MTDPPNGSVNQPTLLTFEWEPVTGAVSYSLLVSTTSNFLVGPFLIEKNNISIHRTFQPIYVPLIQNVRYYWRVKSIHPNGVIRWSSTFSFTTVPATSSNVNRGKTDIGIWYNAYGPWDGDGDQAFYPLTSDGTYKYHDARDPVEIDFQLKEIANAKMDFLIFENTNGGFSPKYTANTNWNVYVNSSKVVAQRLHNWNQTHSWKLKYVHAIGAYYNDKDANGNPIYMRDMITPQNNGSTDFGDCINEQAKVLDQQWVNEAAYGGKDAWYHLDGKPLLIVFVANQVMEPEYVKLYAYMNTPGYETSYAAKFTIRFAATGQTGTYGWPAWGHGYQAKTPALGTQINSEVELVSPGYMLTNPAEAWSRIPRDGGNFYRAKGWDRVLANKKPRVLVIAAFNDYLEETGIWPAKARKGCAPGQCLDCVLPRCEPWTNSSGVEDPTMYWRMTKGYINRLRGLPIPLNSLLLE